MAVFTPLCIILIHIHCPLVNCTRLDPAVIPFPVGILLYKLVVLLRIESLPQRKSIYKNLFSFASTARMNFPNSLLPPDLKVDRFVQFAQLAIVITLIFKDKN